QIPLAQVREHLGIPGMDVVTASNFRDKAQMKSVLRAAGVPCARHRLADSAEAAEDFARVAGFPLVVKPPAGAGAKSTFRLDGAWADLMVHNRFTVPDRQWAAGTVYLRGQGVGRVRAVHGLDALPAEVSEMVTEAKLPEPGQQSSGSYEGDGYVILRHKDTD